MKYHLVINLAAIYFIQINSINGLNSQSIQKRFGRFLLQRFHRALISQRYQWLNFGIIEKMKNILILVTTIILISACSKPLRSTSSSFSFFNISSKKALSTTHAHMHCLDALDVWVCLFVTMLKTRSFCEVFKLAAQLLQVCTQSEP